MEGVILGPPGYTILPEKEQVYPSKKGVEGWCLEGGIMGSESTRHESRRLWLASSCIWALAACPAGGANGHGKLTVAGWGSLLLAVALESGIAEVVPHP